MCRVAECGLELSTNIYRPNEIQVSIIYDAKFNQLSYTLPNIIILRNCRKQHRVLM